MRIATRLVLAAVVIAVVAVWTPVLLNWRDGSAGDGMSSDENTPAASNAAGDTPRPGPASRRGVLRILPRVAQPGNTPAKADAAGVLVTARFTPAQKGGVVLLEQRQGSRWQVVSSASQDGSGTADFTDVAPPRGQAAVYRATALRPNGDRGVTTNAMSSNRWTLAFGDQFDGSTLDTSKWDYRAVGVYNPEGSRICSKSDPRAVAVSGGTMELKAMLDPERIGQPCQTPKNGTLDYYLNGHVSTEGKFDFTHGVAAARLKFPRSRGQHGSFWMQKAAGAASIPGDPAKSGAEIDVVEYFGDSYPGGGLASFLYYLNRANESEKVGGVWPKVTRQLPPGDAWWRSYHVFSVEWTPKKYIFRVDGREMFHSKKGVSGVKQFLVLSLLTSDWELPKIEKKSLPSTMNVDWVRVWQRSPSQG